MNQQELEKYLGRYLMGRPERIVLERAFGDEDDTVFEVKDAHDGELLGTVEFSDQGEMMMFHSDEDEVDDEKDEKDVPVDDKAPLSSSELDQLIQIGTSFAEKFCLRPAYFCCCIRWDHRRYSLIFDEIDEKLNLFIPQTGCVLELDADGNLHSAHLGQLEYELIYPEVKVSREEAKQIFKQSMPLELVIHIEDEQYELIYRPHPDLTGVGVEGQLERVSEFLGSEPLSSVEIKPVPSHVLPDIESMLGLDPDSRSGEFLLYENDAHRRNWIHADQRNLPEEEIEYAVSIYIDETVQCYESVTGEWSLSDPELPREVIVEKAVHFLEKAVGDIHEKYRLEEDASVAEVEEIADADEELDEEWEEMLEPTVMLTFVRVHRGLVLEDYNVYIHIGKYSGIVRECIIQRLDETKLAALDITPKITLEEAVELYFKDLEMTLVRSLHSLDRSNAYTLTYLPEFPEQHVEKINAHTGQISYVDSGILRWADPQEIRQKKA